MSKYAALWEAVRQSGQSALTLRFDEIAKILGFPIDHSFLNAKKELAAYGYCVGRISLKEQTVVFVRNE